MRRFLFALLRLACVAAECAERVCSVRALAFCRFSRGTRCARWKGKQPIAFSLLWVALWQPCEAAQAVYKFVSIADTTGRYSEFSQPPTVNAQGDIAFVGRTTQGISEIVTFSVNTLSILADTSGRYAKFGTVGMNDRGVVVFHATLDNGLQGIYSKAGESTATIVEATGFASSFDAIPHINVHGVVAFQAAFMLGKQGIYTGNGGAITAIAETNGEFRAIGPGPWISDAAEIAFSAVDGDGQAALFIGGNGEVAKIADREGDYRTAFPAIGWDGTVAYRVGFHEAGGTAINLARSGVTTSLATNAGPFSIFSPPSLAAGGRVAFAAILDSFVRGIYTGPDPSVDRVIQTGDELFESTVHQLSFFRGLNDRGEIAFQYRLASGIEGIALAQRVPEPGVLATIAVAVVAFLVWPKTAGRWTSRLHLSRDRTNSINPWISVACAFVLVAVLDLDQAIAQPNYRFINIADSCGPLRNFARDFALNNHGAVAFWAVEADSNARGIFVGSGGPISTIAHTSGPYTSFSPFGGTDISDSGAVAFFASLDEGGAGVFRSDGVTTTTIAFTARGASFSILNGKPAINQSGEVAFWGRESGDDWAVFIGSGSELTLAAHGSPTFLGLSPTIALTDDGFASFIDAGRRIQIAKDGAVSTIIEAGAQVDFGPWTAPITSFYTHSMNSTGSIVFIANVYSELGIYVVKDGIVTNVANHNEPLQPWGRESVAINDNGTVAFVAARNRLKGIYTRGPVTTDRVIQGGDALFGSTLADLQGFIDINNRGDIAFQYRLANGVYGIAIASAVPEPGATWTVHAAFLAYVGLARRVGHKRFRG